MSCAYTPAVCDPIVVGFLFCWCWLIEQRMVFCFQTVFDTLFSPDFNKSEELRAEVNSCRKAPLREDPLTNDVKSIDGKVAARFQPVAESLSVFTGGGGLDIDEAAPIPATPRHSDTIGGGRNMVGGSV